MTETGEGESAPLRAIPLGVRWPNLIYSQVYDLSVTSRSSAESPPQVHLFRIELDTLIEDEADLKRLLTALNGRNFAAAADILIDIRRNAPVKEYARFVKAAFQTSEKPGCIGRFFGSFFHRWRASPDSAPENRSGSSVPEGSNSEYLPPIHGALAHDYAPEVTDKEHTYYVYRRPGHDPLRTLEQSPGTAAAPFPPTMVIESPQEEKIMCAYRHAVACIHPKPPSSDAETAGE